MTSASQTKNHQRSRVPAGRQPDIQPDPGQWLLTTLRKTGQIEVERPYEEASGEDAQGAVNERKRQAKAVGLGAANTAGTCVKIGENDGCEKEEVG